MKDQQARINFVQNFHVALWLMKDASWCHLWKFTGAAMAGPALLSAIYLAWHSRKTLPDLIHNIAICIWICANIVWMLGEFFFDDGWRRVAGAFFYSGMALLVGYYIYEAVKKGRAALWQTS